jgi:hypothetical protein
MDCPPESQDSICFGPVADIPDHAMISLRSVRMIVTMSKTSAMDVGDGIGIRVLITLVAGTGSRRPETLSMYREP